MHDTVKAKVKESVIEDELRSRVRALGGLCEKVTALSRRGFFDRIVFLPGAVYFVELKRPKGGRLSVHQQWYRSQLESLRIEGVVIIKNSADIDALFADYEAKKRAGS